MPDESGLVPAFTCDELLDRAQGPEGYYGVFTTNMHIDQREPRWLRCHRRGRPDDRNVPVVSGRQMLTWLDGRNGSSFDDLVWNGNALSFSITTAAGARHLRGMLPTLAAVGALTGITRDGAPIAYTAETIKGIEYAFFPAETGSYAGTLPIDRTRPVITAVAAPHADGTATITWTTSEPARSRVDYGTDPGLLGVQRGERRARDVPRHDARPA